MGVDVVNALKPLFFLLSLFLTPPTNNMHHILALLIPAWGHTASYLYLATKMLRHDPELVISIVQHKLVRKPISLSSTLSQHLNT